MRAVTINLVETPISRFFVDLNRFSRDFEASPLHVGKKSPPVIISPAKERRLASGGAPQAESRRLSSNTTTAPPLQGTPIPIVRETHIITTDRPGRVSCDAINRGGSGHQGSQGKNISPVSQLFPIVSIPC